MELSSEYRKSKRGLTIICSLSLAWITAQIELQHNDLSFGGFNLKLLNDSLPVVLAIVILYLFVRLSLEYVMQPKDVRRWKYAKLDYLMSLWLARFALLFLPFSSGERSLAMIGKILGVTLIFNILLLLIFSILFFSIVFLFSFITRHGSSVASSVIKAESYAIIIFGVFYIGSLVSINVFEIKFLSSFFIEKIGSSANLFILIYSIFGLSFIFERVLTNYIFAFEPEYNVKE